MNRFGGAAGSVLAKIGPAAIPALMELLADKNLAAGSDASVVLGKMGPTAVPALLELRKDKNERIRRAAVKALMSAYVERLVPTADEDGIGAHEDAATAAISAKNVAKDVIPALIESLKDEDPNLSGCRCSGPFDPQREASNTGSDGKLIRDTDSWVQLSAADSLGNIGPAAKAAIPALTKLLRRTKISPFAQRRGPWERWGRRPKNSVPALTELLRTRTNWSASWQRKRWERSKSSRDRRINNRTHHAPRDGLSSRQSVISRRRRNRTCNG